MVTGEHGFLCQIEDEWRRRAGSKDHEKLSSFYTEVFFQRSWQYLCLKERTESTLAGQHMEGHHGAANRDVAKEGHVVFGDQYLPIDDMADVLIA